MKDLRIKRLTVHQYKWTRRDLTGDYNGFNHVYLKGGKVDFTDYVLTIETEGGITGEYAGGVGVSYAQVAMVAQYLIGKNALQRELIWNDLKRALRKHDKFGMGPIDCALWDIAGKVAGQPVHQLLGGWRHEAARLCLDLPRRRERRPRQPRGVRRVRRAVQGDGLPGLQDPRLGPWADRARGGGGAGDAQGRR